ALAFWWSMIFEPHPCRETRKLGTSCWDRRREPVCRGPGRRQVCFKFGGRSIGERRVQAAAVVDVFEEAADRRARVVDVAVGCSVDLLLLERAHEALRLGIVVGTANAAHARPDVVYLKDGGVIAACVLHAAVGMMDQAAWCRPPRRERHGEG